MKMLSKRGFTLVELMIVIAIIGIVLVIASPNLMTYMAERRLKGAARMVMSDLMLSRQRAVSQNHEFKVFFNGDHITYTVLDDTNSNGAADTGEATETKNIQTDYYDVTFSASANPVFSPKGTTAPAATVTLTSSRTGGARYVKVATTGRVKIDDAP